MFQGPTSSQPERFPGPPSSYYNSFYPPGSHPGEMHNGAPPPNMTPGFHGPPAPSAAGPPPGAPADHSSYRPPMYYPGQYPPGHHPPPHMGYMRPPYGQPPDHMHPESWRYRAPYPGAAPPHGPTYYGEQQIQRYPANAGQPPYQPSPAPRLQVNI